jgi:hypothetical protein
MNATETPENSNPVFTTLLDNYIAGLSPQNRDRMGGRLLVAAKNHIAESERRALRAEAERDEAKRLAAAWEDSAAQFCRNECFYRDIIVKIGEPFGIAAKTSDDGSVQQDVLTLKVPELVAALRESARLAEAKLKAAVEALNRIQYEAPIIAGGRIAVRALAALDQIGKEANEPL